MYPRYIEPAQDNTENRKFNHAANLPLDTPTKKKQTVSYNNNIINQ